MLIGWNDIKRLKLLDVMAQLADAVIPPISSVAPEDQIASFSSDSTYIAVACDEASRRFEDIQASYVHDVFSGVLSDTPALLPAMKIDLVPNAKLPPSCGPQRQSAVIRKFIADSVADLSLFR